jgi:hypothetical protein
MNLLFDISAGFVLAVSLDFVALGFSRAFKAFKLVADAG